jgi:phage/plasmid-associated DNA primase
MESESEVLNQSPLIDLCNSLSPERKNDKKYWLKIVGFLHREKLDYTKFNCYEKYKGLEESYINSLQYNIFKSTSLFEWLRIDNNTLYEKNKFIRFEPSQNHEFNGSTNEAELARIFYSFKPDSYIYISSVGWYCIEKNNVWKFSEKIPEKLEDDIYEVMLKLCVENFEYLQFKLTSLSKENTENPNRYSSSEFDSIQKNIFSCISKINKIKDKIPSLTSRIIKFLIAYYQDNDAIKKMDANQNLFACNNKVFDCEKKEWRDIKQDDYISLTTGYDYSETRNEKVKENINKFFNNCFESEDVTNHLLKVLARCINGYRKGTGEKFYVLIGFGRNGKGLTFELINGTFGSLYHTIQKNELTKAKEKANEPSPTLANGRGKRVSVASEPEKQEKLQIGTIKEITGGDELNYRDLYQKGKGCGYVAQFGLFLQTNYIPNFTICSQGDNAFIERLEVIRYPYEFKPRDTFDSSNPSHKIADNTLGEKLKSNEYRLEFLHMLIDIYKTNDLLKELVKPDIVKKYTDEVILTNNKIGMWIKENFKSKVRNEYTTNCESCPENSTCEKCKAKIEEYYSDYENGYIKYYEDKKNQNYGKGWMTISDAYNQFKSDINGAETQREFEDAMRLNGFDTVKYTGRNTIGNVKTNNMIYKGLIRMTKIKMINI